MENEETFKIIFWLVSIVMFVVAIGIILFLQSIYHSVYAKINGKPLEESTESTEKPVTILSDREMEVLLFTLKGYSAFEVADRLNITKRTVERHKENMKDKTDSKNFTGVIYYALSNHIISSEDLQK